MLWKLKMHEQKDSLLRTKKLIRNSFQSLISMFSFFSPIIHQDGIKSCSIPLFRLIILTVPSLITPPCRQKEPVKPHSQAFWDINEYCKNCVGPVIIFQDGCNENPTPTPATGHPSHMHFLQCMVGSLLPHPQNLGGPVATAEVVLYDSEAGCLHPANMLCYKDNQATCREHREPASGARRVRKETPVQLRGLKPAERCWMTEQLESSQPPNLWKMVSRWVPLFKDTILWGGLLCSTRWLENTCFHVRPTQTWILSLLPASAMRQPSSQAPPVLFAPLRDVWSGILQVLSERESPPLPSGFPAFSPSLSPSSPSLFLVFLPSFPCC